MHSLDNDYILNYVLDHVHINKRGCWMYTGPRGGTNPYPTIMIDRREYALTALIIKAVGKVDNIITDLGLNGCHTCDDGHCLNPDHIFPGTDADNIHDAIQKGRHHSNRISERGTCVNGHPFDVKNTWWYRGYRWCRACARDRIRKRKSIPASKQVYEHMQQVSKIQIKEIQEMIKACGGNKRMAAELLDITPWTLYDRWRKAGLPVDKARWNKRRKR